MDFDIEIIITLYKCALDNSNAFKSLTPQIESIENCNLLIYNNDTSKVIEHNKFEVYNAEDNNKLYGAYNYALRKASESNKKWILPVDQDTVVPENYLNTIKEFILNNSDENIVALAPILISTNGIILSPTRIDKYIWRAKALEINGTFEENITAFNSLSLLRVDFLKQIGGFSSKYPLDMLDYWLYAQIYKHNKKAHILNIKVNHDLSLENLRKNMPLVRYKEYLKAEKRFVREELSSSHYISYKIRLILRIFSRLIKDKNKNYAHEVFKTLIR